REAYTACRAAVEDELENHRTRSQQETKRSAGPTGAFAAETPKKCPQAGYSKAKPGSSRASEKQQDYIHRLVNQVKGLSSQKLHRLCEQMYQKPVTSLSGLEASNMIDTLREVQAGRLDITAV
ncbi:MAG: hypothetical protein ACRC10_04405, partial [Thermoguttaceae bacterium]